MATLELLAEQGIKGMSMDAVAARAGASKATIYRRWRSKEELVSDLLDQIVKLVQPVDTGDPRADLIATSRGAAAGAGPIAQLLPRLLGAAASDPALEQIVHDKLLNPRRAQIRGFVQRAIDDGELRPDTDVAQVADMLFGSLVFLMQTGQLDPVNVADRIGGLWDTLVEGVGTDRARRRLKRQRAANG